jgi:hypothetical protein
MSTPPRVRPERTARLTDPADSACPGQSWPRGLSAGCSSDACAVHRDPPPPRHAQRQPMSTPPRTRAARAHSLTHSFRRFVMPWPKLSGRLVSSLPVRYLRRPPRPPAPRGTRNDRLCVRRHARGPGARPDSQFPQIRHALAEVVRKNPQPRVPQKPASSITPRTHALSSVLAAHGTARAKVTTTHSSVMAAGSPLAVQGHPYFWKYPEWLLRAQSSTSFGCAATTCSRLATTIEQSHLIPFAGPRPVTSWQARGEGWCAGSSVGGRGPAYR